MSALPEAGAEKGLGGSGAVYVWWYGTLRGRWELVLAADLNEAEYARILDLYGIVLAVRVGDEWTMVSNLAGDQPTVRREKGGLPEKQMRLVWRDGKARPSDLALLKKSKVAVTGNETVFLFCPVVTEHLLARLELKRAQADGRAVRDGKLRMELVRRTRFTVHKQGDGYVFEVTEQELFGDPTDKPKEEGLE